MVIRWKESREAQRGRKELDEGKTIGLIDTVQRTEDPGGSRQTRNNDPERHDIGTRHRLLMAEDVHQVARRVQSEGRIVRAWTPTEFKGVSWLRSGVDEVLLMGHCSKELEQGRHRYSTSRTPGGGLGASWFFSV